MKREGGGETIPGLFLTVRLYIQCLFLLPLTSKNSRFWSTARLNRQLKLFSHLSCHMYWLSLYTYILLDFHHYTSLFITPFLSRAATYISHYYSFPQTTCHSARYWALYNLDGRDVNCNRAKKILISTSHPCHFSNITPHLLTTAYFVLFAVDPT